MKTQCSVEIDAPIDLVFELTNNDVSKWSLVVIDEEIVERTDDVVGSRFRSVTSSNGKELTFEGVVTKYECNEHSACQLTGRQFDIDVGYWFEELDGRTRVTQVSVVTVKKWLMSLVFKFMKTVIEKQSCDAAQKELESLKSYCEFKRDSAGRLENLGG